MSWNFLVLMILIFGYSEIPTNCILTISIKEIILVNFINNMWVQTSTVYINELSSEIFIEESFRELYIILRII